jgi:hypothetical protein
MPKQTEAQRIADEITSYIEGPSQQDLLDAINELRRLDAENAKLTKQRDDLLDRIKTLGTVKQGPL